MSIAANENHGSLEANNELLLANDYELNGTVNRAANEGAKFALIMAMLEQDCSHRPQLEKPPEITQTSNFSGDNNFYPSQPLSANDNYWQTCQQTQRYIQHGHLKSAQLWLTMHPEPLSQHNNADIIDVEVIANCSSNTQARLQQKQQQLVKVDETQLDDILQQLEPKTSPDLEQAS